MECLGGIDPLAPLLQEAVAKEMVTIMVAGRREGKN
jgi:hypothetical protein